MTDELELEEQLRKAAKKQGEKISTGIDIASLPYSERRNVAERIRREELKRNHPNRPMPPMSIGYEQREEIKNRPFNYSAYQIMTPNQILSCEKYEEENRTKEVYENFLPRLNELEEQARKSRIVCRTKVA